MKETKLKEALANNRAVIGTKSVLKNVKSGELQTVFVAKNCPDTIKKDLSHYASLSSIEIVEFDGTGKQLGTFCGKPFSIAMIGIKK